MEGLAFKRSRSDLERTPPSSPLPCDEPPFCLDDVQFDKPTVTRRPPVFNLGNKSDEELEEPPRTFKWDESPCAPLGWVAPLEPPLKMRRCSLTAQTLLLDPSFPAARFAERAGISEEYLARLAQKRAASLLDTIEGAAGLLGLASSPPKSTIANPITKLPTEYVSLSVKSTHASGPTVYRPVPPFGCSQSSCPWVRELHSAKAEFNDAPCLRGALRQVGTSLDSIFI